MAVSWKYDKKHNKYTEANVCGIVCEYLHARARVCACVFVGTNSSLGRLKECLDKRLACPRAPLSEDNPRDTHDGAASNGDGMDKGGGESHSLVATSLAADLIDAGVGSGSVEEEADGKRTSKKGSDAEGKRGAEAGAGDTESGIGFEDTTALAVVSGLAGKVIANVAAEEQRKKKAAELRKLAEAEVHVSLSYFS